MSSARSRRAAAALAAWGRLALGGRHPSAHMSHWHKAGSDWAQARVFPGHCAPKKKGKNHIPERWKDCLPVGQRMPGTRFIAFKVPLKNKLIGVHCTHGLNRTGYLICRYLIDVEGMRPDDAIELFNRCRGNCIERKNYIEDLQNGPARKNWGSSRSRSSGFEASPHLMEPMSTTTPFGHQGSGYNFHRNQVYPAPSWHFHAQPQDFQHPVRTFSHNQHVYQRGLAP
ncbi:LOW QUALITY PROTEIN: RNA/RNP complex-1-interacting phosphatase-like, partial [Echinops telfairi]|uniref:LOW QUALITY PROTEIN: RNA/RNP complex-1-interacting phosphatase-like n=1 Tax=Echinops telfairi TaxID=9371 RepID=A0AC55CYY3_ECHTE